MRAERLNLLLGCPRENGSRFNLSRIAVYSSTGS